MTHQLADSRCQRLFPHPVLNSKHASLEQITLGAMGLLGGILRDSPSLLSKCKVRISGVVGGYHQRITGECSSNAKLLLRPVKVRKSMSRRRSYKSSKPSGRAKDELASAGLIAAGLIRPMSRDLDRPLFSLEKISTVIMGRCGYIRMKSRRDDSTPPSFSPEPLPPGIETSQALGGIFGDDPWVLSKLAKILQPPQVLLTLLATLVNTK